MAQLLGRRLGLFSLADVRQGVFGSELLHEDFGYFCALATDDELAGGGGVYALTLEVEELNGSVVLLVSDDVVDATLLVYDGDGGSASISIIERCRFRGPEEKTFYRNSD